MIAVITMLIDHIAAVLLDEYPKAWTPLFSIGGVSFTFYEICRDIGRVAFPIYCFLLTEGFIHTHSRFKYGLNLLIFALISEIPFNFIYSDTWSSPGQNVFFTLLLGYLGMWAMEYFRDRQLLQVVSVVGLLLVSTELNADYGWEGFVFILIMYLFRTEKPAQAIIGSCCLHFEWKACFAFLSINMYNGERGFIKGKAKYLFYAFYPLHITVLVFLRRIIFGPIFY